MQVHVCTQVVYTVVENQNLMQCDFLQATAHMDLHKIMHQTLKLVCWNKILLDYGIHRML